MAHTKTTIQLLTQTTNNAQTNTTNNTHTYTTTTTHTTFDPHTHRSLPSLNIHEYPHSATLQPTIYHTLRCTIYIHHHTFIARYKRYDQMRSGTWTNWHLLRSIQLAPGSSPCCEKRQRDVNGILFYIGRDESINSFMTLTPCRQSLRGFRSQDKVNIKNYRRIVYSSQQQQQKDDNCILLRRRGHGPDLIGDCVMKIG